jgi:NAD(P)-dependent dehydrogenase (short-subunit alcohol dehydrogenase family)
MDTHCTVVTGAASGIGRATAKRFAAGGDHVVIADVDPVGAARVVDEILRSGGQAQAQHVDVAEDDSVQRLARTVTETHGAPRALVNCAGVLQNLSRLETFDLAEHDRIWRINYRGTYLCCQAFGTAMAAAGRGVIVNISSTSAVRAFPLLAYGPGKAAIDQLTAILCADLGPRGVRVNAVIPGYVRTEQMQARIDSGHRDPASMDAQSALGRMVEPEEVAEGVHFLCSDAAAAITGISLPIDCGWLASVTYRQYPGWTAPATGGEDAGG